MRRAQVKPLWYTIQSDVCGEGSDERDLTWGRMHLRIQVGVRARAGAPMPCASGRAWGRACACMQAFACACMRAEGYKRRCMTAPTTVTSVSTRSERSVVVCSWMRFPCASPERKLNMLRNQLMLLISSGLFTTNDFDSAMPHEHPA